MTGAAYDPRRGRPGVHRVPGRVQPDAGMRAYLARLLGHALEGRVIEHLLPIFHGDGAQRQGHADRRGRRRRSATTPTPPTRTC